MCVEDVAVPAAGEKRGVRPEQQPAGTGHLERILFNEKMQELRRESLLTELRQRIRDGTGCVKLLKLLVLEAERD